ncbi:phosphatidylinositol-specific phospholipase C domain-containing protein [Kibdelosporangium persicum]|uniref:Calcium-dependent phosphoinositide phospholipase C n=1 Tax=Kibdelosporangium persicum TaxID=2698649 RepID=A0ABX2EWX0_9PSEU|nr:phosphatidylinositol-specific phospholipase C domain-containing protein [Kibdelosporangium persicum]NRN63305.1 Calcium-dependent phosphoinositide phospholipase C [Kibdelosporangium persicum]
MKRLALTLATAALIAAPTPAHAADASIAGITGVGVHNAYEQATFPWLADALESGASMIEIDLWQNFLGSGRYQVSHEPWAAANNCSSATSFAALRTGSRNQGFEACLRNIKLWHDQNPTHAPLIIKLEAKNGYDGRGGYGPDRLDALIASVLGAANVVKPADVKGSHATLDAAVRAGAWPSRESLRGKFLFTLITGAFEAGNPFDNYDTHHEYADYLTSLGANLGSAMMFPTINGASSVDPRTGGNGGTRAQWYVTFDGDAGGWFSGDTSFYTNGNYLVTMASVHSVAPAIDGRNPTVQQAQDRVRQAAAKGATVASSDWNNPAIVGFTVPRG